MDHPKREFSDSSAGDGPDATPGVMQQNRGYLSDSAVGSVLVVVPAPILQLLPGVFKAHEPMGVQAFRPQIAVERFDKGIVGRLSGPAEV